MKKIALFPGSFDPITNGHVDIIKKSLSLFDQVVIGIGTNTSKKPLFSIEQRMAWIREVFKDEPRLDIQTYSGLTIAFCKQIGANFIIRGLRSGLDFEYEQSIAFANKEMDQSVETILLLSSPSTSNISSTIVRDIIINQGDYSKFVPAGIFFNK
jgi:pantetheine-phosphate adenylyltransferase